MDDTTTTGTGGPGSTTGAVPSGPGVALASRMHLSLADLMAGSLDDQLIAIEALTQGIATADPVTESDRYGSRFLGHAALRTHLITQALTGAQLDWMGLESEAGTWDTSKGLRTYPHYVAKTYGISGASARRMSTLATGLRNSLPATRTWLRTGKIGIDQAQILLKATTTQAAVDGLQYPATPTNPNTAEASTDGSTSTDGSDGTDATAASDPTEGADATESVEATDATTGSADASDATPEAEPDDDATPDRAGRVQTVEEFLLANAATRSPEDLRRLVDHFVAIADPDATDKAHHAASDREYLNIDRTMDGYHLAGFLTLEHGQYVRTALEAIMGKPAAGETRTSSQRRAQALSDLAHTALDHGKVGTSGSVRPHLGVLINYPEFLDIITTTETTEAATGAGAAGTEDSAADEGPDAAEAASPTAPPQPITEPLPGLDTTTDPTDDPADHSPRSNAGPTTTDTAARPANEPGTPAQAPTVANPATPAGGPGASAQAPTPTNPATPVGEPGASAQAPTPATGHEPEDSTPTASNTSPPGQAPAPSPTSEATGLPDCQSRAVGALGQPTSGTAVPGTNSTALPGTNGTALPSIAVPGIAVPGIAVPGIAVPGIAVPSIAVPGGGRDWAALLAAGPATFTDNTGPVPRDLLDRIIGCSGETYRIIFGPDNEILNHGRAHRLYTAAQRRAIIARDRHCVYHNCTAPPERCETHHGTKHWADGGNTDLHDAGLACYYHHHWIHTHNITMTRHNGKWHFYRPDGTEIHPTNPPWN
ncbi:HNH endonuclease signature motif containing protein [Occultella kanbiaonis]|uniref:HNH endonuclease signature motif containing protein n=1 Tax=Occultella kanbiaonis TaxID=2675754 RepID=UPI0012B90D72|nr:HNH endonuclease signature motif containing protein [Occultella kanbiaonis]